MLVFSLGMTYIYVAPLRVVILLTDAVTSVGKVEIVLGLVMQQPNLVAFYWQTHWAQYHRVR